MDEQRERIGPNTQLDWNQLDRKELERTVDHEIIEIIRASGRALSDAAVRKEFRRMRLTPNWQPTPFFKRWYNTTKEHLLIQERVRPILEVMSAYKQRWRTQYCATFPTDPFNQWWIDETTRILRKHMHTKDRRYVLRYMVVAILNNLAWASQWTDVGNQDFKYALGKEYGIACN